MAKENKVKNFCYGFSRRQRKRVCTKQMCTAKNNGTGLEQIMVGIFTSNIFTKNCL